LEELLKPVTTFLCLVCKKFVRGHGMQVPKGWILVPRFGWMCDECVKRLCNILDSLGEKLRN
jgi:uncharacterized protein YlaI